MIENGTAMNLNPLCIQAFF